MLQHIFEDIVSQSLLIQGRFQHGVYRIRKNFSTTDKSQSLLIQGRFQPSVDKLIRCGVVRVAIPSDSGQVSTGRKGGVSLLYNYPLSQSLLIQGRFQP